MRLEKLLKQIIEGKAIVNPLLCGPVKMNSEGAFRKYLFIEGRVFGNVPVEMSYQLLDSDKWELWDGVPPKD